MPKLALWDAMTAYLPKNAGATHLVYLNQYAVPTNIFLLRLILV